MRPATWGRRLRPSQPVPPSGSARGIEPIAGRPPAAPTDAQSGAPESAVGFAIPRASMLAAAESRAETPALRRPPMAGPDPPSWLSMLKSRPYAAASFRSDSIIKNVVGNQIGPRQLELPPFR